MIEVDKEFSFPTFVAIVLSMIELFWRAYRLAFSKHMANVYFISVLCSITCSLTFHSLIMISASKTNEMAKETHSTLQCLKGRFPLNLKRTKFKEVCTRKSNLTLWKIYVLDRPLLITSFGTLLTYGFLIGTVGEAC
ncbi:uncharacterized protein TNIN_412701 [Trichonephila inaurata madagascariensis]|uniref:Uncharacterized protein n=1 Tax=Trichonephila inaurata madagascariensis TaxID=2747483 RepID=A0A8X6XGT4_9ARAC|nr:uncharacterized protein TNIN_412701 [Trichonephila inaurata madagascariensis]